MAFPKLEIGVNTSNAEDKPTRTVALFSTRCNYANLLMRYITAQKSKNRTEDATKLTKKLNKAIPQIEAEYKISSQNSDVAKMIGASYIAFRNNYDVFKETK